MSESSYDAIVVGAGHNGLVTAAYLAKAGIKTAVFEARPVVGGAAVTEELWPGYKVSRCAYVNSLFQPEIVRDLELKKYGFEMLARNPSSFTPFPDGRHLMLGPDPALVHREISKFSTRDAGNYPRYEAAIAGIAAVLEPMMAMVPPNPGDLAIADLWTYGSYALGHRSSLKHKWPDLVRVLTGSGTDLLNEWFDSEQLKVTLATDAVIGANASPSQPGTAYVLLHHVMGSCDGVRGVWGYMRGGMGALSGSIASACRAMGVTIHTDAPVERIQVRNGRVAGVVVRGGNEYTARLVASGADPNVTFNKLIDETALPEDFLKAVRRINYDSASVKINLALSELPDFLACPGIEPGPQHRGTIHISPDLQFIENAFADSVMRRPSRAPMLECTIPSVVDPTVAPPGRHLMNVFSQYGPYTLADGLSWATEREAYADRCIDLLAEYAPNIRAAILHREVLTPLDLEREFHLTGGNIFHGRMTLDQMFSMRPVAGFADYRTPIRGLYLCGSGTHPGGGVMGLPGRNAAGVMLKDFRRL
jgi:phytoene dehydrogenase-like protein